MITNKQQTGFERAAMEIYFLLRSRSGVFTRISGFLKRNDSSKISRQINPSDTRRDNFYKEILKFHCGLADYSPELEAAIWQIIERERSKFIKTKNSNNQKAELIDQIFSTLGKVISLNLTGDSPEDLVKEGFELAQITQSFYEQLKIYPD